MKPERLCFITDIIVVVLFSQSFVGESKTPAGPSERNEKSKGCNLSTPRKRLLLSHAEKEKLLTWDVLVTADETPNNDNTRQHKEEVTFIGVRTISTRHVLLLFISPSSCCLQSYSLVQRWRFVLDKQS